MHGAASKALAKGYPNLWTSHLGWTLLGMLLASLGAFGCLIARLGLPGDWPSEIVETGLMGLIVVWLLPFAVRGLIASLKGRQFLMALVILMFGGTFAAGLVNGLLMPGVLDCAPPGFSVPLALALLALVPGFGLGLMMLLECMQLGWLLAQKRPRAFVSQKLFFFGLPLGLMTYRERSRAYAAE